MRVEHHGALRVGRPAVQPHCRQRPPRRQINRRSCAPGRQMAPPIRRQFSCAFSRHQQRSTAALNSSAVSADARRFSLIRSIGWRISPSSCCLGRPTSPSQGWGSTPNSTPRSHRRQGLRQPAVGLDSFGQRPAATPPTDPNEPIGEIVPVLQGPIPRQVQEVGMSLPGDHRQVRSTAQRPRLCRFSEVFGSHRARGPVRRAAKRTPNGIRTRAATLRGWCPWPLDDGGWLRCEESA